MGLHQLDAEVHQSGGTQGSQNDVAGGGGQTATDDVGHKQQNQDQHHQMAARQEHDDGGALDHKAGLVQHGYDDRGAGHHGQNGHHRDGGGLKGQHEALEVQASLFPQHGDHHDQDGADGAAEESGKARVQHVHQHQDGDDQGEGGHKGLALGRQLLRRQALHAQLLGHAVHKEPHGEVEHERRQEGVLHYVKISGADVVRDQEGHRAHNRGRDLPAGGSHGLYGAGHLGPEAGLFHHGDGKGAGGDHIGHGAARHHSHGAAGQHGHLGGTAGGLAGDR